MVPTGPGAFLSNVLFSLELTPPSTIIWPLQTIYRERGVKDNSDPNQPASRKPDRRKPSRDRLFGAFLMYSANFDLNCEWPAPAFACGCGC